MNKKTIVFDFDGVIHKYSKGWQDGSIYDEPVEGIKEVIEELRKDYKVVIVSTRTATTEGELVKYIAGLDIDEDVCKNINHCTADDLYTNCEECIIKYFTKKCEGK